MKKVSTFKKVLISILLLLSTVIVSGCGGGGGGGDGGDPGDGLIYIGKTTQAIIDENNAEALALGAFAGGDISNDLLIGAVQNREPEMNAFNLRSFDQQIKDAIFSIDLGSQTDGIYAGAIITESETVNGPCGGSYDISITLDDVTGDFNGNLTYKNFCEDGVTLNGPSTFSGEIDLGSLEFINIFIKVDNVTSSDGVETVTIDGDNDTVFHDGFPFSWTVIVNSLIKFNSTGKVFKLQNYQMDYSEGTDGNGDFVKIIVTGKYYDPDYGYVDIITPTAFKFYFLDMFPSEGIFILDGANGIVGGSTKTRFTALNDTSYMIEADTTGDDAYDYNSGPINW